MIEGHVVRELLIPDLKLSPIFTLHEIFHGVTAPGFLFGAGFTFAIATQRRWAQSISFTPHFIRRIWRAIVLIFIGYSLHIPYFSLQKTITTATAKEWNILFCFDVLQCIGVSLLFIRFLLFSIKEERRFIGALIILLFTIVYSTPFFWDIPNHYTIPLILSSAIQGATGSPFPLFPFMGFIFAGTCVSWLYLRAAQAGSEKRFITWLIFVGTLLIGFSAFLDALPYQSYSKYQYWYTSPNYFWMRLGILLLILGGLWFLERLSYFQVSSKRLIPKWLTILGIESLFIYIMHLLILYGWVTNVNLNFRLAWSGRLNLTESLLMVLLLSFSMIPMSYLWHYLKKQHPVLMKGIFFWIGFSIVWSFCTNPY